MIVQIIRCPIFLGGPTETGIKWNTGMEVIQWEPRDANALLMAQDALLTFMVIR